MKHIIHIIISKGRNRKETLKIFALSSRVVFFLLIYVSMWKFIYGNSSFEIHLHDLFCIVIVFWKIKR